MEPVTTAALIGAGTSLLSGFLGARSQSRADKAALDWQKQLANNQIFWRVQDAKRAGISPLAALGAPVMSSGWSPSGGNPMGDAIAAAGGELGRGLMQRDAIRHQKEMDMAALHRANVLTGSEVDRNIAEAEESRARAASIMTRTIQTLRGNQDGGGAIAGEVMSSPNAGRKITSPSGSVRVGPHTRAEDAEGEYGDVIGSVLGLMKFGYDSLSQYLDEHGSVLDPLLGVKPRE